MALMRSASAPVGWIRRAIGRRLAVGAGRSIRSSWNRKRLPRWRCFSPRMRVPRSPALRSMPLAVRIRCFASPVSGKGFLADGTEGAAVTSIQSMMAFGQHAGAGRRCMDRIDRPYSMEIVVVGRRHVLLTRPPDRRHSAYRPSALGGSFDFNLTLPTATHGALQVEVEAVVSTRFRPPSVGAESRDGLARMRRKPQSPLLRRPGVR